MSTRKSQDEPPPIIDGTPSPQSLAEIETLINRLYQPGQVELVSSIEKHLQWHQQSANGWNMADTLLESPDATVRFFGALTIVVKLNHTAGDIQSDRERMLLSQFIKMPMDEPRVLSKFSQALAQYYLHPKVDASNSLRRAVASMAIGRPMVEEEGHEVSQSLPSVATTLISVALPPAQIRALLMFASLYAEQAAKLCDSAPARTVVRVGKDVSPNLQHAVALMQFALQPYNGLEVAQIRGMGAALFLEWTALYHKAFSLEREEREMLIPLVRPTLEYLSQADLDSSPGNEVVNHLTELLSQNCKIFTDNVLDDIAKLLQSTSTRSKILALQAGEDDSHSMALLLVAYGQADLQRLLTMPDMSATAQVLDMLHILMRVQGYATIEDEIILDAYQFWADFLDMALDFQDSSSSQKCNYAAHIKVHIMQLLEELFVKFQRPPEHIFEALQSDERKQFNVFRTDLRDLLQTTYAYLGSELLHALIKITLEALTKHDWYQIEAGLFSLGGISAVLEETDEDAAAMAYLFNSPLFVLLSDTTLVIPVALRLTALSILNEFNWYFERDSANLPSTLNFLFLQLEVPIMADRAAKAIAGLCSVCSSALVQELETFFSHYERFLSWPTATSWTKERVIKAVASISQALPTEEARDQALNRLLNYVEVDIKLSLELMAAHGAKESHDAAYTALQCLLGIGKAFQDSREIETSLSPAEDVYWTQGRGVATRQRIERLLLSRLDVLREGVDVLDSICAVLKVGYTEVTGPFLLSPAVTVRVASAVNMATPSVISLLGTICTLLSSYSQGFGQSIVPIDSEAGSLLRWLADGIRKIEDPREDPELTYYLTDTLSYFLKGRYLATLLNLEPSDLLEAALKFVTSAIVAPEPMSKKVSCSFWTTLLGLMSFPQDIQTRLDAIVVHFGPQLALTLVAQAGGGCSKSDLEFVSPPLKKLLTRTPHSRRWLEEALLLNSSTASISDEMAEGKHLLMIKRMQRADRVRILGQLGAAREGLGTRKIVQELWEGARKAMIPEEKGQPQVIDLED